MGAVAGVVLGAVIGGVVIGVLVGALVAWLRTQVPEAFTYPGMQAHDAPLK